jgi:hypothetical protein
MNLQSISISSSMIYLPKEIRLLNLSKKSSIKNKELSVLFVVEMELLCG